MHQLFGDVLDTKEDLIEYRPIVKRQVSEKSEPPLPQTRAYSTRGVKISLAKILGISESRVRGKPASGGGDAIKVSAVNGQGKRARSTSSSIVDSSPLLREKMEHKRLFRGNEKDRPSRTTRHLEKKGTQKSLQKSLLPTAAYSRVDKDSTSADASAMAKRSPRQRKPNLKYYIKAIT